MSSHTFSPNQTMDYQNYIKPEFNPFIIAIKLSNPNDYILSEQICTSIPRGLVF